MGQILPQPVTYISENNKQPRRKKRLILSIVVISVILLISISSWWFLVKNSTLNQFPLDKKQPGTASVTARTLTNQLLKTNPIIANAKTDVEKNQAIQNQVQIATTRKAAMTELITTDPKQFLLNSLPQDVTSTLPIPVQDLVEKKIEAEGKLSILHIDNFKDSKSEYKYVLTTKQNQRYDLSFANTPPRGSSGTTVKINGVGFGNNVALLANGRDFVPTIRNPYQILIPPTGDQKVLIIPVKFANQPEFFSVDQARNFMFGDINQFIKESSYNKTSLSGEVSPWITLNVSSDNCQNEYYYWLLLADNKIKSENPNINFYSYPRRFYIFYGIPSCSNFASGLGNVSDPEYPYGISFVGLDKDVVTHEFGHNLGLWHAASMSCPNQTLETYNNCNYSEYGDPIDAMGSAETNSGGGQYNLIHKRILGWLPTSNIKSITEDGEYDLFPMESASSNTQMLSIISGGSEKYTLEYRNNIGQDSGIDDSVVGVNIHKQDLGTGGFNVVPSGGADTIFFDPSGGSKTALRNGQVFDDPFSGINIEQLSNDDTKARVKITFGDSQPCQRAKPSVSLVPASKAGTPGQSIEYTLVITNNDSGPHCETQAFIIEKQSDSENWNIGTPATINVAPGIERRYDFQVQSPSDIGIGSYPFGVTVKSINDDSLQDSAQASYIVSTVTLSLYFSMSCGNNIDLSNYLVNLRDERTNNIVSSSRTNNIGEGTIIYNPQNPQAGDTYTLIPEPLPGSTINLYDSVTILDPPVSILHSHSFHLQACPTSPQTPPPPPSSDLVIVRGMRVNAQSQSFDPGTTITALSNNQVFSSQDTNPYSIQVQKGLIEVSSTVPNGYDISSSICLVENNDQDINLSSCHGPQSWISGSRSLISLNNGYADISWKYTPVNNTQNPVLLTTAINSNESDNQTIPEGQEVDLSSKLFFDEANTDSEVCIASSQEVVYKIDGQVIGSKDPCLSLQYTMPNDEGDHILTVDFPGDGDIPAESDTLTFKISNNEQTSPISSRFVTSILVTGHPTDRATPTLSQNINLASPTLNISLPVPDGEEDVERDYSLVVAVTYNRGVNTPLPTTEYYPYTIHYNPNIGAPAIANCPLTVNGSSSTSIPVGGYIDFRVTGIPDGAFRASWDRQGGGTSNVGDFNDPTHQVGSDGTWATRYGPYAASSTGTYIQKIVIFNEANPTQTICESNYTTAIVTSTPNNTNPPPPNNVSNPTPRPTNINDGPSSCLNPDPTQCGNLSNPVYILGGGHCTVSGTPCEPGYQCTGGTIGTCTVIPATPAPATQPPPPSRPPLVGGEGASCGGQSNQVCGYGTTCVGGICTAPHPFIAATSLYGIVFLDSNQNGNQDPGEVGIDGASITFAPANPQTPAPIPGCIPGPAFSCMTPGTPPPFTLVSGQVQGSCVSLPGVFTCPPPPPAGSYNTYPGNSIDGPYSITISLPTGYRMVNTSLTSQAITPTLRTANVLNFAVTNVSESISPPPAPKTVATVVVTNEAGQIIGRFNDLANPSIDLTLPGTQGIASSSNITLTVVYTDTSQRVIPYTFNYQPPVIPPPPTITPPPPAVVPPPPVDPPPPVIPPPPAPKTVSTVVVTDASGQIIGRFNDLANPIINLTLPGTAGVASSSNITVTVVYSDNTQRVVPYIFNYQPPVILPPPPVAPPPPTSNEIPTATTERIFVTSNLYNGNLGGLTGADNKCRSAATSANLTGNWKAWLSDTTTSAATRLTHSSVPYKLVNGRTIANDWADLIDGNILAPIKIDEHGSDITSSGSYYFAVWTNTLANGQRVGDDSCLDWTTNAAFTTSLNQGATGDITKTTSNWTWVQGAATCNNSFHLYCVEQ